MGKVLNYYASGNTARGFYSLFESNLKGLDRLFILKGGPGTGKSTLIKKIGNEWVEKGFDVEYMHCSADNGSLDGVIIPKLKAGIVDGTPPHVIEPMFPGVIEEYVNLGAAWDSQQLSKHKKVILQLTSRVYDAFQSAYAAFKTALAIHDEWEEVYIKNIDVKKANQLGEHLITSLLSDKSLNKKAVVKHRFLGAATPIGPVDFIPNLTEGVSKRIFLKGRPGSGKSTLLKKLARAAERRGFNVEVYHCGFDPKSIDMIIVRELDFAIFDSTAPHEHFPNRDGDELLDLYQAFIQPGTDETYAQAIENFSKKYSANMKEGTSFLAKAKSFHDLLESYYIEAMDFTEVENVRKIIQYEFERLADIQSLL